jgi:hypothetical protein
MIPPLSNPTARPAHGKKGRKQSAGLVVALVPEVPHHEDRGRHQQQRRQYQVPSEQPLGAAQAGEICAVDGVVAVGGGV